MNGELVYAVGDIHGRYDLLKLLLEAIVADHRQSGSSQRPVLVFCGDYIDRGPQSAAVLEALVQLQRRTDVQLNALRGNHEQALLDFIDDPVRGAIWVAYGGSQTMVSYGLEPPAPQADAAAYRQARDALLGLMPAAHLRFLESLPLALELGDHYFVHAGVRPGVPLALQDSQDLLWIRKPFIDAKGPFEKVIVHGHSWVDAEPTVCDSRIGLDTGAYATGVLTAVRLGLGAPTILRARGSASGQLE
ncbi:metallophosphoesterase family protein [Caulobacter segnis]|uniref:metallophosphoesterase family protein n=1 Tax=Caulobacter segnis TaxID=88688 RepID=UPI00240FF5B8|nr:metallophosphoesterase family protein [Caulobacter segnis]MDG2520291.1 metallophosphoesterase family protein [Caulobacter segnis]